MLQMAVLKMSKEIVLVTDITGAQIKLPLDEARNYPFAVKIERIDVTNGVENSNDNI